MSAASTADETHRGSERPALLQPPRLRSLDEERTPRHASWLELFYDLVFVVVVSELAAKLGGNVSLGGVLGYVLLFIPIWSTWTGMTFYNDRFDTDDLIHRGLIFLQMLAVGALAINVHDGLNGSSTGFALAYVAARALLVASYIWARHFVPNARPLTTYYAKGFSLAAAIWLVSVFIPAPYRFVLWVIGVGVEFATPLTARRLQERMPLDRSHLPERFGLFTLIVLGESIIGVVHGVAEQEWRVRSAGEAAIGLAVAFCVWWMYFDNVDESVVQRIRFAGQIWVYGHLPLVMGLTATGVGVEHLVAHDTASPLGTADRWLICGAVATVLAALGVILLTMRTTPPGLGCTIKARYRFGGAVACLLVGAIGGDLRPLVLISLLAAICAAQVVIDEVAQFRQGASTGDVAA